MVEQARPVRLDLNYHSLLRVTSRYYGVAGLPSRLKCQLKLFYENRKSLPWRTRTMTQIPFQMTLSNHRTLFYKHYNIAADVRFVTINQPTVEYRTR